jgi:hypothetical protein
MNQSTDYHLFPTTNFLPIPTIHKLLEMLQNYAQFTCKLSESFATPLIREFCLPLPIYTHLPNRSIPNRLIFTISISPKSSAPSGTFELRIPASLLVDTVLNSNLYRLNPARFRTSERTLTLFAFDSFFGLAQ